MDRRSFTASLGAGALTGMTLPGSATILPNWDDEEVGIPVLSRPDFLFLQTVFEQAPSVLEPIEPMPFQAAGLKLILTPTLNTNGRGIRLQVSVEIKSLARPLLTSDANAAGAPRPSDAGLEFFGNAYATGDPGILVRKVQTTVGIEDGQTVVIGGLVHTAPDESRQAEASLPFFGDLPVLGHVFRSVSGARQRDELVIFITPRIVQPD